MIQRLRILGSRIVIRSLQYVKSGCGFRLKSIFREDDAGPWGPDEKKVSKIVFIGKSLDEKFIRAFPRAS